MNYMFQDCVVEKLYLKEWYFGTTSKLFANCVATKKEGQSE